MEFGQAFWVAVSFCIFVAVVFRPISSIITKALDERSGKIRDELGEALRLKEEAQALLASYQRKQREVVEEAENIIKEAEATAVRITREAEIELDVALNKRIEVAVQKIATYEANVMQQIKHQSVDIAVNTVRSLLAQNINKEVSENLILGAIGDMQKKLH